MITVELIGERRRLLMPAATTAIMLAVLMSLGFWQVHRLAWKRGLLASIDQAETLPPAALADPPRQFQKVYVTGQYRRDLKVIYGAQVRDLPQGPAMGGQLIVPLRREGSPDIMVDRGWIPENAPTDTTAGIVTVSGYIRVAEHPGWFSATDDVAGRHFYTLDPEAMARSLGIGPVAPFTLVVLGEADSNAARFPVPAQHLPRPPNDHLSYAITWFGLAMVLAGVFIAYVVKKDR